MYMNKQDTVKKLAQQLLNSQLFSRLPLPINCKRRLAFTMAEIVLVLIIIGIISSLVIPPLLNDIQDAQLKTAWKKRYAEFSQATKLIAMNNGGNLRGLCIEDEFMQDNQCLRDLYAKHLRFSKNCTSEVVGQCWSVLSSNLNGTLVGGVRFTLAGPELGDPSRVGSITINNSVLTGSVLVDGSYMAITYFEGFNVDFFAVIALDVNGAKKPNVYGKDINFMLVNMNTVKILPFSSNVLSSDSGSCIKPGKAGWSDSNNEGTACSQINLTQ